MNAAAPDQIPEWVVRTMGESHTIAAPTAKDALMTAVREFRFSTLGVLMCVHPAAEGERDDNTLYYSSESACRDAGLLGSGKPQENVEAKSSEAL